MNLATTPLSWNACLSGLRLDRWIMGELAPADAETVGTHVSACAACSTAVAGIRGVREEVHALPLPLGLVRPAARRRVPRAASPSPCTSSTAATCAVPGRASWWRRATRSASR